jgi:hypothetical protein
MRRRNDAVKPPPRRTPTSFRGRRGWVALALLASASTCHQKEPAREAAPNLTPQKLVPAAPEPNREEAESKKAESAAPAPPPAAADQFAARRPAPAPAASGAVSPQPAKRARERSSVAPERRAGGAADDREADEKGKGGAGVPSSLLQRLDNAVNLDTPDCPSARERRKSICALARQICRLVDRDPNVASVEGYCDDARQRCNEAERRTAERCDR